MGNPYLFLIQSYKSLFFYKVVKKGMKNIVLKKIQHWFSIDLFLSHGLNVYNLLADFNVSLLILGYGNFKI